METASFPIKKQTISLPCFYVIYKLHHICFYVIYKLCHLRAMSYTGCIIYIGRMDIFLFSCGFFSRTHSSNPEEDQSEELEERREDKVVARRGDGKDESCKQRKKGQVPKLESFVSAIYLL